MNETKTAEAGSAAETLHAEPVFVDATGRRARLVRRGGLVAGALLGAYLALVGVSLVAGADVPLTPWTGGAAGGGAQGGGTDRMTDLRTKTLIPRGSARPEGPATGGVSPGTGPNSSSAPPPARTTRPTSRPSASSAGNRPASPAATPTPAPSASASPTTLPAPSTSRTPPAWGKKKKSTLTG